MTAAAVIYSRLTTDAACVSALGSRIFQQHAEQDTAYPYVVIEEFDPERFSAMGEDLDIARGLVRVNLWIGRDAYPTGQSVSATIRAALQRWRGTAGSVVVDDIFIVPGSPVTWDDFLKAYNFQRDYEVIYRE